MNTIDIALRAGIVCHGLETFWASLVQQQEQDFHYVNIVDSSLMFFSWSSCHLRVPKNMIAIRDQ